MFHKERNCIIILISCFLAFSIWILSFPYDPQSDIVDAVSVDTWAGFILDGRVSVPLSEWLQNRYTGSQSGVVRWDDTYYVVPEKGIGYILFYAIFLAIGAQRFVGVVLSCIACISTYLLCRRLFDFHAATFATLLLLTSGSAMIMTYRNAWVDYGTMAFVVLSFCLFIESFHSGKLAILSGISFAVAISTRYPIALLIFAPIFYTISLNFRKLVSMLGKFQIPGVIRLLKPLILFILGAFVLLLPLFYFNTVIYGSPLKSGYDVPRLSEFLMKEREKDLQNVEIDYGTSASFWSLSTIPSKIIPLLQMFALGMPTFYFSFLGIKRNSLLFFLLPWILIVLLMYLPVSHIVGIFAMQETRYYLPMLPALCILSYGFLQILRKYKFLVPTFLILLAFLGMTVTVENINHWPAFGKRFEIQKVTVQELVRNPATFQDKPLRVEHLMIVHLWMDGIVAGPRNQELLLLTRGPPPPFRRGDTITVDGIFRWEDKNGDKLLERGEGIILVKSIKIEKS